MLWWGLSPSLAVALREVMQIRSRGTCGGWVHLTHKVRRTQGRAAASHGSRKNSGAQQWLCTRSAYTIFHHYGGEKTLNYWSAPLLPLSLCLSLSPTLRDWRLFLLLLLSFLFQLPSLALRKFASATRLFFFFSLSLFLKWIPAVKEKHKRAGPTWKLPPQQTHKTHRGRGGGYVGGGERGWTQHFKHLRNLMQSGATALQ